MSNIKNFEILDCTIRDGGYYTNWDFSDDTVDVYIEAFNDLPVEFIEIGYRSNPMNTYLGRFFYCPIHELKRIREKCRKKLAIILNEKDVREGDVENLLAPCIGLIDMVRIAVDPQNIERAVGLAKAVKKHGFIVAFNVMYMSEWSENEEFIENLKLIGDDLDYFYMVDSFGGVTPDDVEFIFNKIRPILKSKIGFHGHNNLELALINSLKAIELGADIIDATVLGMGRGAGNLKTELLLTFLQSKDIVKFDFNKLSLVIDEFAILHKQYDWGTNLPYMVSGANSLPQKMVMEWVTKRFYSFNSILRALSNQSVGQRDNIQLPPFDFGRYRNHKKALIVGGGSSIREHSTALIQFLNENEDILVIHASAKNGLHFKSLNNQQIFCLIGNEGYRLESVFDKQEFSSNMTCILPPYPRKMGTYIPDIFKDNSFEIEKIDFVKDYENSHTSLAIQTAIELKIESLYLAGYDGYLNSMMDKKEQELFMENSNLFELAKNNISEIKSLSPTKYENVETISIYSMI